MKRKGKGCSAVIGRNSMPAEQVAPPLPAVSATAWLSANKVVVSVCGLFVTFLIAVIGFFSNAISSSNERHHDEVSRLQSQLQESKQALAAAAVRVGQLEELQQEVLRECLDVVGRKDAEKSEHIYGNYLNREVQRLKDQSIKGRQ